MGSSPAVKVTISVPSQESSEQVPSSFVRFKARGARIVMPVAAQSEVRSNPPKNGLARPCMKLCCTTVQLILRSVLLYTLLECKDLTARAALQDCQDSSNSVQGGASRLQPACPGAPAQSLRMEPATEAVR